MRVWIIANNPGYWFLHCHIEPHQMEGMAVIINEVESEQNCPPPELIRKCGDFEWDVNSFNKAVHSVGPCSSSTSSNIDWEIVLSAIIALLVPWSPILLLYIYCTRVEKKRTNRGYEEIPNPVYDS